MKNLLTLILLFATTLVSAQITEITYNEEDNVLNVDQIPYELFGEPDLLWGDVVRRHHSTRQFTPRPIAVDGRTFNIVIDMYGLQPEQYSVNYGKEGEFGIDLETFRPYGITTIEMPTLTAEFTVPSEGVWHVWYTTRSLSGAISSSGADQFTVE